ncbi:hypothetical protein I7I50_03839 [Histoplasma capsulatum G186AR]|uniref:Uncharacterized protein n=1 Tax=Ajellomyces capsulatus TaxID=5037 RepID=A0A8H7YJA5_AJECA|nr:hypothetical protein I7I52_04747 [Histoplasma capsulatum]QSS74889.1 hypothetical protein I7I50_03839 [Histoplasma capsulatum G186AR]
MCRRRAKPASTYAHYHSSSSRESLDLWAKCSRSDTLRNTDWNENYPRTASARNVVKHQNRQRAVSVASTQSCWFSSKMEINPAARRD